jgi:hypothetical protein
MKNLSVYRTYLKMVLHKILVASMHVRVQKSCSKQECAVQIGVTDHVHDGSIPSSCTDFALCISMECMSEGQVLIRL